MSGSIEASLKSKSSNDLQEVDACISSKMETDSFTFLWLVESFSAIRGGKNELFSPIFKSGEGTKSAWRIRLQHNNNGVECLGFSLFYCGEGKVNVRFEVTLQNQNPSGQSVILSSGPALEMDTEKGRGWESFVSEDKLLNSSIGLVVNDTMKFHVHIWVLGNWKHQSQPMLQKVDHERERLFDVCKDFGTLLNDTVFADVTLLTGTKTVLAHKNILAARSPVFNAKFCSLMKDSKENVITIPEIFAEDDVKSLLEFIYTGKCVDLHERPEQILKIADYYAIEGLKEDCELEMLKGLNVDNSAEIYTFADIYNAKNLKAKVIEFIKWNKNDVLKSESFKHAKIAQANIFVELLYKISE